MIDIEQLTIAELYQLQVTLDQRIRDMFQSMISSGILDDEPGEKQALMMAIYKQMTPTACRDIPNRWNLYRRYFEATTEYELGLTLSELESHMRDINNIESETEGTADDF